MKRLVAPITAAILIFAVGSQALAVAPDTASQNISEKELTIEASKIVSELLDKAEQDSLNSLKKIVGLDIGAPLQWNGSSTLTVSSANAYNYGVESSVVGWGAALADDGTEAFADVECTSAGYGSCSGWAWTGVHVKYTGSSAKDVQITVNGKYAGWLVNPILGGSTSYRVRVSVYDYTTDSEITGTVVAEKTVSTITSEPASGNVNKSMTVTFYPGHSYLIRLGVASATTSVVAYGGSVSDFYDGVYGGSNPRGADLTSISIKPL